MPSASVQRSIKEARIATYREAILDAANTLFAEKGWDAVKMADIAAGAGVAKGTLYNYFESKEAVFGALMDRSRGELTETIDEVTSKVGASERPRALLQALFGRLEEGAAMVRLYMQVTGLALRHEADPHACEGREQFRKQVTDCLSPLVDTGELRSDIPIDRLVTLFSGLASATIDHWAEDDAQGSLSSSIDDILSVFFHGAAPR